MSVGNGQLSNILSPSNCPTNTPTINYSVENIIEVSFAVAIFIIYNIFYGVQLFYPMKTNLGNNIEMRKHWIRTLLHSPNSFAINGIQAMRNGIMSSSFFASSSIIVAIFAATTAKTMTGGLLQIQVFILSLVMGWNFLHWLLAIKGFTHLTYFFGIYNNSDVESDEDIKKEQDQRAKQSEDIIQSTTIHYFLGIRGFFISFCLGAWIFHPIAALVVTIIVIVFMYLSDHIFVEPPHEREEK